MLCALSQPRRTPIEAFLPLLASRAPGELHAFAALAHMLSDKLPPDYARQLVTAGTDTVVALVAALGMPVRLLQRSCCNGFLFEQHNDECYVNFRTRILPALCTLARLPSNVD